MNCMFKIIPENKDRITLDTEEYVTICVFDYLYQPTYCSVHTV